MSIYDKLNEPPERGGISYRWTSVDPGGCRFGKDPGTDAQDRISDRRAECESVEYPGDHVYEQGSRRDERKVDSLVGFGSESIWVSTFSFDVCADFKKIYRPAWV